jgi:hypothetical protein
MNFVGSETSKVFETLGDVVGMDEIVQRVSELNVIVVVIAFDGGHP